jgi:hypothetical protein
MSEPDYEMLDKVYDVLSTDTFESPSTIARRAHVTTHQASQALRWLVANNMCTAAGNGSWTKFRMRRFGEYNR